MYNEHELIGMETLERLTPLIRSAAHPLRLRILDYLRREGDPRTVSDIMEAARTEQSITSQQLRILKDQGILRAKRVGTNVFYDIADRSILHLLDCIRMHGCVLPAGKMESK